MDNAAFHKGQKIQQILEADGHTLLYLPTYSPIERKWAQAKAHRRRFQYHNIHELFQLTEL